MNMLELRQVRAFVAVAVELHFGRAARNLGIAQPALSQQIQRFEREIGLQLFERSRRSVRLTPAGMLLLDDARVLLDQAGRLESLIAGIAAGSAGRLSIGFVGSAALVHLPDLIARFRSAWPDVELSLREMSTTEQLEALDTGSIDVGCVRMPVESAGDRALLLARERLVLAVPESLGMDLPEPAPLPVLSDAPFILPPRQLGHSFHDTVVSACVRAGFMPHIAQEAVQMQTIVGLVAAGMGVSLVPESVVNSQRDRVVWRALDDPMAHTDLTLIWRNSDLPMLRRLLELVAGNVADSALHSERELPR
jgi:DNA-binding transcriptional LysR family regulator